MYLLYSILTITLVYIGYTNIKKITHLKKKQKTFEDVPEDDEYLLLCYKINFKNGEEKIVTHEITSEEVESLCDEDEIDFIIIDYVYNGKMMKYLTYNKNIQFPIYDCNTLKYSEDEFKNLIEVILNGIDITHYIIPFLGPKYNFYLDKGFRIKLKTMLYDHPEFNNFDFENGEIILKSDKDTVVKYDLPWTPMWKRFSGEFDKSVSLIEECNNTLGEFTILNK